MASIHNSDLSYDHDFKLKALELGAAIGLKPAARQLEMPYATLWMWTRHPDYAAIYADLRKNHAPAWRARAAATMEELVDDYASLEADALKKAAKDFDKLEPRDIGNFLRSVAVAKGVTADHVGKLRGQPDVIVERRVDARQLEEAMQKLLDSVPGTAEELPPAEELPEGSEDE